MKADGYDALLIDGMDIPRGQTEDFWSAVRKRMKPGAFAHTILSSANQLDLAYMIIDLAEAGWETGFTTTAHVGKDTTRLVVTAMCPLAEKTHDHRQRYQLVR